jgi:hypothetical protein
MNGVVYQEGELRRFVRSVWRQTFASSTMGGEGNNDARVALGTGTALAVCQLQIRKQAAITIAQRQTGHTSQAEPDTSSPAQTSRVKDGKASTNVRLWRGPRRVFPHWSIASKLKAKWGCHIRRQPSHRHTTPPHHVFAKVLSQKSLRKRNTPYQRRIQGAL